MEHPGSMTVEITMSLGYDAVASTSQRSNQVSSSARFVSLLLLTLLSVSISVRAQSPAKTVAPKPARGTVSGRITIKDKPAPGVAVGLRKSLGSTPFPEPFQRATTDQDGNYRITNVAPGTYDIEPSAPAYVIADVAFARGKNVVVGDDEEVEDINFSLVRGGVITGKVTDADGRPVIQQTVNLFRANDFVQNPRQVFAANNVQTDDRGIYRFFGLAAGQYKVAVGRSDGVFAASASPLRATYKQVFHPDTPDQAKATPIDVREGSEATNVDIALGRAVQTFSASGKIIDGQTGLPVPNLSFGLQRTIADRVEMVPSMTMSNVQGDFVVDGLTPGRYVVYLFPNENSELRAEGATFEIVDQDVNMITVKLTKGASVSGTIVLEHEDAKGFVKLRELQLRAYTSAPANSIVSQSYEAKIAPDGSFRLTALSAGALNIWLASPTNGGLPKGFVISRIEQNGLVLPRPVLQIKDGDQLTGVRIVVSYGTASLRGVVNYDRGLMPEGARMFARLVRPGSEMNTIAQVMVDARGHFLMEGLPSGVYELTVTLMNPVARTQPQALRQQVTVQDGVVSDVSLTLELAPPKP